MYPIANYLTTESRQEAAKREYRPMNERSVYHATRPCPVCEEGNCPLGVALGAMLPRFEAIRPDAMTVSRALGDSPAKRHYALQFIDDWDRGLIKDLADALGVKS